MPEKNQLPNRPVVTLAQYSSAGVSAGKHDPIPTGAYHGKVESVTVRPTKQGNGLMAVVRLRLLDGDTPGRCLFDHIMLKHPTRLAVEIGERRLAALRAAAGVAVDGGEDALRDRTVQMFVEIRCDGPYGMCNCVTWYIPPNPGFLRAQRAALVPTAGDCAPVQPAVAANPAAAAKPCIAASGARLAATRPPAVAARPAAAATAATPAAAVVRPANVARPTVTPRAPARPPTQPAPVPRRAP